MQKEEAPDWLSNLELPNVESLQEITFPRRGVLESSVFYPASHFHGDVIKRLSSTFHSFIYVDYSVDQQSFDEAIKVIRGYSVEGYKSLTPTDLSSPNTPPALAERFHRGLRRASEDLIRRASPFASWVVMKRDPEMTEEHGPRRFSLVFIAADGAAAYHRMYAADKIAPRALAIIQPGHAFGGNYTNFTCRDALLAHIVLEVGGPAPKFLLCGGKMYKKSDVSWWPQEYSERIEYFSGPHPWSVWQYSRQPKSQV